MRGELGDGYVEALRSVYAELPESIDYVMYWWHRAAELIRAGTARRFGFITTNSLRQTFQRRVLVPHLTNPKNPASLVFAIPDHPWVDSTDGAAVRIAMTVAEAGSREGLLLRVVNEEMGEKESAEFVDSPVPSSVDPGKRSRYRHTRTYRLLSLDHRDRLLPIDGPDPSA